MLTAFELNGYVKSIEVSDWASEGQSQLRRRAQRSCLISDSRIG